MGSTLAPSRAKCTSFKTKQLGRILARRYDAELAPSGLKSTQYSLLTHVMQRGPLSMGDLAQLMGLDGSSATRNLRPLITKGWLTLGAGEDGRQRCVGITTAGKRKQAQAHAYWEVAQQRTADILGQERLATLHALIDESMQSLLSDDQAQT